MDCGENCIVGNNSICIKCLFCERTFSMSSGLASITLDIYTDASTKFKKREIGVLDKDYPEGDI